MKCLYPDAYIIKQCFPALYDQQQLIIFTDFILPPVNGCQTGNNVDARGIFTGYEIIGYFHADIRGRNSAKNNDEGFHRLFFSLFNSCDKNSGQIDADHFPLRQLVKNILVA